MGMAILRVKKLKHYANIAASLEHCFRERETHNADGSRTNQTRHYFLTTTDEALEYFRANIPETVNGKKRRADAVRCIEFVLTASPDFFKAASKGTKEEWINRSVGFLENKFGKKNIVVCSLHEDETTPHLSAFVMPYTQDGKLCAKSFLGGRDKLSKLQDEYHNAVADLGLQRGIRGSKAHHRTIAQYYTGLNELAAAPQPKPVFRLPKQPGKLELLKDTDKALRTYGSEAVRQNTKPLLDELAVLRARDAEVRRQRERLEEQQRVLDEQKEAFEALVKQRERDFNLKQKQYENEVQAYREENARLSDDNYYFQSMLEEGKYIIGRLEQKKRTELVRQYEAKIFKEVQNGGRMPCHIDQERWQEILQRQQPEEEEEYNPYGDFGM